MNKTERDELDELLDKVLALAKSYFIYEYNLLKERKSELHTREKS